MEIRNLSYQTETVRKAVNYWKENPVARVMLVAPTGTGKTIIARLLVIDDELREVLLKNKTRDTLRIIYKCHVDRLLTQAKRRFDQKKTIEASIEDWKNPNYICKDQNIKVEIVYQMYSNKIDEDLDCDLIIYDECQHEACNTIQEFLTNAGRLPSFGMTATPDRPDNCMIKFDEIIEALTRKQAVEQGFICETDINTIVDSSNRNKVGLLKDILLQFHEEMKQTMIFVSRKTEITETVNFINTYIGENLAEGCNDGDDVDDILDRLGEGEFKFIVSCKKLGEGIDIPGITDVIFARNIGSIIELNQYIGRSARIDVPECRVWEFCNSLSDSNLDTRDVVGTPKSHRIINKVNNKFIVRDFM